MVGGFNGISKLITCYTLSRGKLSYLAQFHENQEVIHLELKFNWSELRKVVFIY